MKSPKPLVGYGNVTYASVTYATVGWSINPHLMGFVTQKITDSEVFPDFR